MNISIIIPVYNVELYIERCLDSIMNQTFTDGVECIIVNDCSPDKSLEIAQHLINQYKGNILFRIISHDKNQGVAAARNTGLKAAQGEYIIQIDSDDYCEPNMLEEMYKKACENESDIVVTDFWEQYTNEAKYISQDCTKFFSPTERIKAIITGQLGGYSWNKLIKRNLFTKHNLSYLEGHNFQEDYLMTIKLFYYTSNITYIPKAYVHYCQINPNSYLHFISKASLQDILFNQEYLTSFLQENGIYSELRNNISLIKAANFQHLIFRSKGKLQKEWYLKCKKGINLNDILHNTHPGLTFYWKTAAIFALYNMLPVYNLMRFLNRLLLPNKAKSAPLYT